MTQAASSREHEPCHGEYSGVNLGLTDDTIAVEGVREQRRFQLVLNIKLIYFSSSFKVTVAGIISVTLLRTHCA
jgi:hypothetical protein